MRRVLPLLLAPALFAQAPGAPTVDQLIAKHTAALGGQAKLDAVKSFRMVAVLPTPGGEATLTLSRRFPDCARVEVEVMGQSILTVTNAEGGATLNPFAGQTAPQSLPAGEFKQLRQGGHPGGALLAAKQQGALLESIGLVELPGGIKAYKVKATAKDGEASLYFLDASTHLMIRAESKRPMMGQLVDTISTFKDFKPVSGLTVPYTQTVEAKNGAFPTQVIEVSTVEVNPVLPDSLFVLTASK